MKITTKFKARCLGIVALSLSAILPLSAAPPSDSASFTIDTPSAVPGASLVPGAYTIKVLNRLSDRVVLRVEGANGEVSTTFLGVTDSQLANKNGSGSLAWQNTVEGKQFLRGWNFPGMRSTVEFVYPKDDAVKIATANPAKVPAVDPASEGKPADNTISQSDMQLLNLWLLHLDKVGTEGGGIKAEHYVQASTPKARPVVASLPHTASYRPVVWFMTPFFLLAAGLVRVQRLSCVRKDASAGAL